MDKDFKIAKVAQSGAIWFATMSGNYALSDDITQMQWLLDIGVIDSIERGGKRSKYMGLITKG